MKKFFAAVFVLLCAGGVLFGARTVGGMFDDVKAVYRDELSKSQILNQNAQRQITELMEENARLREELEKMRASQDERFKIEGKDEKEDEDVRHQVIEGRAGESADGVDTPRGGDGADNSNY